MVICVYYYTIFPTEFRFLVNGQKHFNQFAKVERVEDNNDNLVIPTAPTLLAKRLDLLLTFKKKNTSPLMSIVYSAKCYEP